MALPSSVFTDSVLVYRGSIGMSASLALSRARNRPSVSERDLITELGIEASSVAVTTVIHSMMALRLGNSSPLLLFAATAAALTFWRGLGPGILASSLGSVVGPLLYTMPASELTYNKGNVSLEALLLGASSL